MNGACGASRFAAGGSGEITADEQRRLVAALARHLAARHGGAAVRTIETHISYVLLAGDAAYKLKKAIALPFVDYTTRARRRHFCDEELRLNGRLAPALYRGVVDVRGSPDEPVLDGPSPPIDHMVLMRAFDDDALLSERLARGDVASERIDELAARVAAFHAGLPPAASGTAFGAPERVLADALENFDEIAPLVDPPWDGRVDALRRWTQAEFARCAASFAQRRRAGCVRECHGDLHLRNVALVDGVVTVFDGIEFSDELRWIDVASEVAFTAMDLCDRGRDDYAWRFLDGWFAATGDYDAAGVLRYYLVYRAMVRAKVRLLRAAQLRTGAAERQARAEAERYLVLAERLAHDVAPAVVLMHGASGAGKSTFARVLCERLGAIRLRTDVERKRMHGLAAAAASRSATGAGLYTADATQRTYDRLAALAAAIVGAGYTAVLDGTFLERARRERMRELAARLGAAFVVVDVVVPPDVLRERVARRAAAGGDPSEATLEVLERQLARAEPLAGAELACVVAIDGTTAPGDPHLDTVWSRVDSMRRAARGAAT